ncbi:hypothetical protein RB195_013811 [Necator americanus]|uniref:Uncharacterized protein n=1 Tax=Necator americanus TaxID=51031 RepID=A0ABR1DX98_NECAM
MSENEPQDANYDRVLDLDESLLRTCLSEGEQDNPVVDNEAEKTNLEDKEAKAREHMQRSPTKDENVLGKEIPKKLLKELDDSERKNEKQKSKQETAETKVIEKKVEQPNAENEKEKEKEKKGSKESIGGKNSKDKETNKAVETSKSALAEKSNTGMQKALQLVRRGKQGNVPYKPGKLSNLRSSRKFDRENRCLENAQANVYPFVKCYQTKENLKQGAIEFQRSLLIDLLFNAYYQFESDFYEERTVISFKRFTNIDPASPSVDHTQKALSKHKLPFAFCVEWFVSQSGQNDVNLGGIA